MIANEKFIDFYLTAFTNNIYILKFNNIYFNSCLKTLHQISWVMQYLSDRILENSKSSCLNDIDCYDGCCKRGYCYKY
jgi:hypothetical protein